MQKIKQIVFDFGNVLFDINLPAIGMGFEAHLGKADAERLMQKLKDRGIKLGYETGALTTDEFLQQVSNAALPLQLDTKQVRDIWNSIFVGMPAHRFEMLLNLRQRYKVYLLSNINDLHLRYITAYLEKTYGIVDFEQRYFDGVYYSHLVRMCKPDLEIYQYLITDAQIEPEETVFFDDLPENIRAAEAVGIKAFWHDPQRDIAEHLQAVGLM